MGKKKPEGGRDKTPLPPTEGPTYDVRIIFHSGANLPIADISTASSDPYILAQCNTDLPTRHKADPPLRFRSATARRSLNPKWEAEWVLGGVPARGCEIKTRVYDEDTGTDDLLGRVHIKTGAIEEGWKFKETLKLTSRGANWAVWGLRTCLKAVSEEARKDSTITVSMEVLGRTKVEVGKVYTMNSFWWTHYSPLLGHMVNTTVPDKEDRIEQASFQANELQLSGPVPNELYHRYVNFQIFVPWMFERTGLRGRALHALLHHQHEEVYHFDPENEYGRLPGPGRAMAQCFLDMARWGEGKRIFTYIITLDGLMRFTETGPEFAIDMLSKHTMHSNVNAYIAFSGEFFVRKYKPNAPGEKEAEGHERNSLDIEIEDQELEKAGEGRVEQRLNEGSGEASSSASANANGNAPSGAKDGLRVQPSKPRGPRDPQSHARKYRRNKRNKRKTAREAQYDTPIEETTLHGPTRRGQSTEPSDYELVIDNDSGTYRPDAALLPVLAKWLQDQFDGLHIAVLSCTDDVNQEIKKKRLKQKQKLRGRRLYTASGSESLSSSDEEAFTQGRRHKSGKEEVLEFIQAPVEFAKEKFGDGVHRVHGKRYHRDAGLRAHTDGDGDGNAVGQGDSNEKAAADAPNGPAPDTQGGRDSEKT